MTLEDLVAASSRLAEEFSRTAAEVDDRGEYPEGNLSALHEAGFSAIAVPKDCGGLSEGRYRNAPALAKIIANIASAESSTAQIWMVSQSVASGLLGPGSPLAREAQEELAGEVLRGARFCSAAAERVKPRFSYRTTATPVEGGMRISGVKRFATGVKGATYAIMPVLHSDFESIEAGGLHHALLRLDAPGVTIVDDWDNMGQRATGSCSVELEDVFVPDQFHWAPPAEVPPHQDISGPANQVQFASILLGIGQGALDAVIPFVQGMRPDPENPFDLTAITQWQIGQLYVALRGAEALVAEAAEAIASFDATTADARTRAAVSAAMMCAKTAATDASLEVCQKVHQFGGGRSTTRASGLDRYWRNARTLSTHDPQDVKKRHLGAWAVNGTHPPVDALS
jgi:alkylation response protein AidB-like acyl-CoA dehydrogenase